MKNNPYLYILLGGLATYLVRLLPFTLIRKPIQNRFIQSFLYYVPYITLSAMIFPAILYTTGSVLIGVIALFVGAAVSLAGLNSVLTALICSAAVYVLELIGL